MSHPHITAIGNAITDILAYVPDSFLAQHDMTKGAMQLVEHAAIERLQQEIGTDARICSGGSAANTVAALASCGVRAGFLGSIADDATGQQFTRDMTQTGITFSPVIAQTDQSSGCCIVCVTPDGERTMNTHIGAAGAFARAHVDDEMIAASDILYLEGYLWDDADAKEAMRHAITVAKTNHTRIAFSMSDTFCVTRHRDEFLALLRGDVDIVFANAQEAIALTDSDTPQQAAQILAKSVAVVAVTDGANAATIIDAGNTLSVTPEPVAKVIDTTGAGDLFAAGFLHGLLGNVSTEESAHRGHQFAGHIITQLGARSNTPLPI